MRYLVECTHVYDHPFMNSGIQRVVRNIIHNLDSEPSEHEWIPVILKREKVYRVLRLKPEWGEDRLMFIQAWVESQRNRYWLLHSRVERRAPIPQSKNLKRILHVIAKLFSGVFVISLAVISLISRLLVGDERLEDIEIRNDDTLILLDSSWHDLSFSQVEGMKHSGVKIISVIYDLIPLTHPQFCDDHLVIVFNEWFEWISKTADGFLSISKTISAQVEENIEKKFGADIASNRWFDHFYLGSDLDLARSEDAIRNDVTDLYTKNRSVYLMVSTIEPRKNHVYLLDAFDQLWKEGSDTALCFIGKVGWKCDELIERIETHPLFNKNLFMFNGLSDTELEYCYKNSHSLVFPSYVEGFGLPIVEAMQRGLPVMASDIPVFREIGDDYCAYFDIEETNALVELVSKVENTKSFPSKKRLDNWKWYSWKDATEQLKQKAVNFL